MIPPIAQLSLSTLLALVISWPATAADFELHVAPILIKRCLECHRGTDPSGGLVLDSEAGLRRGGDSGHAVQQEKPNESLLLQRVVNGEMPPPVKGVSQLLPPEESAILAEWIQDGAIWPPDRSLDLYEITTDVRGGRDWWSFQPVRRPVVPRVDESDDVANPLDAFVMAKLRQNGMNPAPVADSRTMIRRMFHDVLGLPATADDYATWVPRVKSDIDALITSLLDSPHFGERWARYWLDLVRYAESSGYERDQPKAFAWKYRDWVVQAINKDMPYSSFVLHQLAGDEIPDRDEQSVIATGFLRLGTWNDEPNDNADYLYDRMEDMVHATSSAFLGLTVKCARCHDHKFDPIPQEDYYRIASAFWPGPLAARDRKYLGGPTPEELKVPDVLGWTDITSSPPELHVLKNGSRHTPMQVVIPGPLSFSAELFANFNTPPDGADTTQRRLQLARWIIDKRNPLTARVFVNRIWQHYFGFGLVRSPNNFGFKGNEPTHSDLLDWLAAEFMDNNWSAKHIHRIILRSRTWRQSCLHPAATEYNIRDSGNLLLWRANRRRLDAETLRDSLLSVSGRIDLNRIGGDSFKPTISAEALEGFSRKSAVWTPASPELQQRRSLYIYVSRSLMPPMMTAFDQCDTTLPCGQRDVTTVAPQALAMLNNDFTHSCSESLAVRVEQVGVTLNQQIDAAWTFALGRLPSPVERQLSQKHIETQRKRFASGSETVRPDVTAGNHGQRQIPVNGLTMHLTADVGVTADETGAVSRWESGTGQHHATQPEPGARPELVADVINGRPVLRFDGNGQFLQINGGIVKDQHCTLLTVAADRATAPRLREIISNWDRSENVGTSLFLGLSNQQTIRFSDHFNSAGSLVDRQKPFLLTARNSPEGASVWQSQSLLAKRGVPISGRRFGTQWVIGQQGNINGEFWHGDIAEILVYDRPLSTEELHIVWDHLLAEYDLNETVQPAEDAVKSMSPAHRAMASLCHVLLNSNEFLYVD